MWIMIGTKWATFIFLIVTLTMVIGVSGCKPEPPPAGLEDVQIFQAEGILVGQIDSQSVEIEVAGIPRAFRLEEGAVITGLAAGTRVGFTYVEPAANTAENSGDTRPLLLSIEAVDFVPEVIELTGVFIGQIDSHSVEINVEGEARVFALGVSMTVDNLENGTEVFITFRQDGQRQLLISIEPTAGPVGDGNILLVGEGIMVGMIDAQSVEVMINRAFILDQGISAEGIADGSLVAFTYRESGLRAVIESIEAVDQPLEGEVMHGILVGQIDSLSIEIQYFQAFALGRGVSTEGIDDGSAVVFTYDEGDYRPVLKSIRAK